MKSKLPGYIIATAAGLAVSMLVLYTYDFLSMETAAQRLQCLSDAFTLPGVLLLAVGSLMWISQQGTFDFFGYVGKTVVDLFRTRAEHVRYGDYILEKREKRKIGGFGFLLITGAAFMVIAVVFLVLYYAYI